MPKLPVSKKPLLITLWILISIGVLLASNIVLAKSKCDDLEDLDKRAECYGEKIEEKQDEYESTSKQLSNIRSQKDQIAGTISKYLSELNVTQGQIDELQGQITNIKNELAIIQDNLTDRKGKLSEKTTLRNRVLRNYLKKSYKSDLEMIFAGNPTGATLSGFQYSSMNYIFNKALADETKKVIYLLNSEIDTFEGDKKEAESIRQELETTQSKLLSLKADIDAKKADAQNDLTDLSNKEESYEKELSELEDEIESLSSKQQDILKQKYGDEIISGYEASSYKLPNPPFKPAFAALSYGAYTHRNGMSQYGAMGRAEDGQDYKEILEYYYETSVKEEDDFPDEINVQGYGTLDYQYYLYGLAEMPSDWPLDALKAQAIAGRTYAYKANKPICTSQSCQVFLKSKADNPPSRWKQAVDETEGEILDNPKNSQYSSTTGGYLNQTGWDVKEGGSWPNDAYEKIAGSPWFFKAWYTKSYTDNTDTCGRSTPWLSEDEMADILNAWIVWRKGSGSEKDHITPTTTSCWGGDPYSKDEMKEKAGNYETPFTSISNVSVSISSNGYTSKVNFSTNRGSVSIDGSEYMTVFNLRSPGYVSIRGVVGNKALYDIKHED